MLISIFIGASSQIILKKAANKTYPSPLAQYLNKHVIAAYALFGTSALLSMLALRYIPLGLAAVMQALAYIFVAVLGFIFLKEGYARKQLIGMGLILIGIIIFGI